MLVGITLGVTEDALGQVFSGVVGGLASAKLSVPARLAAHHERDRTTDRDHDLRRIAKFTYCFQAGRDNINA